MTLSSYASYLVWGRLLDTGSWLSVVDDRYRLKTCYRFFTATPQIFEKSSLQLWFKDLSAEEMMVLADTIDNLNIDREDDDNQDEEPSKSLIVTNVDSSVFVDEMVKANFESLFLAFDKTAAFYYIRTFRRVRIDFQTADEATGAKNHLDQTLIGSNQIHCYFIKIYGPSDPEEAFLQPPPLEKQFLISPPCSPPVGWEQPREDKPNMNPVVDYDILAAIAQLAPGENHELQPSTSVTIRGNSVHTPSIVVQVCGNQEDFTSFGKPRNCGKIVQTRCPERQHSLED